MFYKVDDYGWKRVIFYKKIRIWMDMDLARGVADGGSGGGS